MSALLWWLIPLGATLAALAWAAWRSRPARSVDMHTSLSEQARFNAAMRRPLPRSTGSQGRDPRTGRPRGSHRVPAGRDHPPA